MNGRGVGQIEIGCDDVVLLREVGCPPDDVVAARLDGFDDPATIGLDGETNPIAHRYGVCGPDSLQPDAPTAAARERGAFV